MSALYVCCSHQLFFDWMRCVCYIDTATWVRVFFKLTDCTTKASNLIIDSHNSDFLASTVMFCTLTSYHAQKWRNQRIYFGHLVISHNNLSSSCLWVAFKYFLRLYQQRWRKKKKKLPMLMILVNAADAFSKNPGLYFMWPIPPCQNKENSSLISWLILIIESWLWLKPRPRATNWSIPFWFW